MLLLLLRIILIRCALHSFGACWPPLPTSWGIIRPCVCFTALLSGVPLRTRKLYCFHVPRLRSPVCQRSKLGAAPVPFFARLSPPIGLPSIPPCCLSHGHLSTSPSLSFASLSRRSLPSPFNLSSARLVSCTALASHLWSALSPSHLSPSFPAFAQSRVAHVLATALVPPSSCQACRPIHLA